MKRHRSGDDPKACAIKTSLLKDLKEKKPCSNLRKYSGFVRCSAVRVGLLSFMLHLHFLSGVKDTITCAYSVTVILQYSNAENGDK